MPAELVVSGDEETVGLGTLEIECSALGPPSVVEGGGTTDWWFEGGVLTLVGFTGEGSVGGLVGTNDAGEIIGSFWDIARSGTSTSAGGTGLTVARMRTLDTFLAVGWDFEDETDNGTADIWWLREGLDYPRLWWEFGEVASP